MVLLHTTDRDKVSIQSLFRRAKKLEAGYRTQLRRIARIVGDIARAHDAETSQGIERIRVGMLHYAERLEPWADSVANRMVTEIAAADRLSWQRSSELVGRLLHKEIETAPTGQVLRDSLQRQVTLIKSLPTEAAERVHKLVQEGMAEGRRTSEITKEIMRSGEVCRSRADTIAVTEVSRAATELTKARCEHVGFSHYVWRTVGDMSVRHDHKILNGKVFSWDAPPIADSRSGIRAHPGCIFRCRCYPEPVLAGDDDWSTHDNSSQRALGFALFRTADARASTARRTGFESIASRLDRRGSGDRAGGLGSQVRSHHEVASDRSVRSARAPARRR